MKKLVTFLTLATLLISFVNGQEILELDGNYCFHLTQDQQFWMCAGLYMGDYGAMQFMEVHKLLGTLDIMVWIDKYSITRYPDNAVMAKAITFWYRKTGHLEYPIIVVAYISDTWNQPIPTWEQFQLNGLTIGGTN